MNAPEGGAALKPAPVVAEDKVIGAWKLNFRPDAVTVTRVDDVFVR